MERTCAGCGKAFEARRSTAKYCGGTCRQRINRKSSAPEAVKSLPLVSSGLTEAVLDELAAAGRADTALGRQALALAARMASPFDTGSAVASLSKELRAVMAEAMKGAAVKADALDELRERRDRKRNAG